jgi:hypothetical protein
MPDPARVGTEVAQRALGVAVVVRAGEDDDGDQGRASDGAHAGPWSSIS